MEKLFRVVAGVVVGVAGLVVAAAGGAAAAAIIAPAFRRKVYVSFDYENDRHYKNMLCAWHANEKFDFKFDDRSSGEVQSYDIGRVKAALTMKIKEADVLLVIIGEEANAWHQDTTAIGYRNWINWEIAKAKELKKKIVAVKFDRTNESPEQLEGAGASWAMSFTDDGITKALAQA